MAGINPQGIALHILNMAFMQGANQMGRKEGDNG